MSIEGIQGHESHHLTDLSLIDAPQIARRAKDGAVCLVPTGSTGAAHKTRRWQRTPQVHGTVGLIARIPDKDKVTNLVTNVRPTAR